MIIDIDSNKLEIGMFIILPDSLFDNPFWRSQFVIENQNQIQKIINAKLKTAKVDTEKSKLLVEEHNTNVNKGADSQTVNKTVLSNDQNKAKRKTPVVEVKKIYKDEKEPAAPSDKWEPEKFMPPPLVKAFKDKKMEPSDRAKVVNDYSMEMMKNIIENPTAENITASKEGIAEIVDVIMNENETCDNLAKIVSHDFLYLHTLGKCWNKIYFVGKGILWQFSHS